MDREKYHEPSASGTEAPITHAAHRHAVSADDLEKRPSATLPKMTPDLRTDLEKQSSASLTAVTPLPVMHILCICLLRLGHPMIMKSPYPWLSEALRSVSPLVTDETLGFFVGMVEGLYTAFVCVALFFAVRLSDRYGRKPVILGSIAGGVVMGAVFGFARSLFAFILLRSCAGLFMSSQAILRVTLAESVDDTNQGTGFALFSSMWQIGALVAPVIGGLLSHPTRFALFANVQLFEENPFLLACIVSVATAAIGVVLAIFFMRETKAPHTIDHAKYVPLSQEEEDNTPPPSPRPDGLKSLVQSEGIKPILHSWMWLMLSQATFESVSIVFASTSIEQGGLGMTTREIGIALTGLAIGTTLATIFIFPRWFRRYGAVRLTRLTVIGTPLAYIVMPMWPWAIRSVAPGESRWLLWSLMFVCLLCRIPAIMAVQALEAFASRAAPQKSQTATLNGMISMIGNSMYSIGPLLSGSILSLSLSRTGSSLWAFMLYTVFGLACVWSCSQVKERQRCPPEEQVVP